MTFEEYRNELEADIQSAYETGPTIEEAEKLAAKFLKGRLEAGKMCRNAALDARMRKAGLKAVKAAVYLEAATKTDKKPSDVMLTALVDSSELVAGEQTRFDTAEVDAEELENFKDVLKEAHIYFRGLSRGRYE